MTMDLYATAPPTPPPGLSVGDGGGSDEPERPERCNFALLVDGAVVTVPAAPDLLPMDLTAIAGNGPAQDFHIRAVIATHFDIPPKSFSYQLAGDELLGVLQ